jgi:hypothetical protein
MVVSSQKLEFNLLKQAAGFAAAPVSLSKQGRALLL